MKSGSAALLWQAAAQMRLLLTRILQNPKSMKSGSAALRWQADAKMRLLLSY